MNNELFTEVIKKINYELPPLFVAMLQESCENVEKSDFQETDRVSLVWFNFYSMLPILKGIIESLENFNQINLNYRGQIWVLTRQSQTYQLIASLISEKLE